LGFTESGQDRQNVRNMDDIPPAKALPATEPRPGNIGRFDTKP
jgi:hypothetical protein